ncbi:ankyrin repeat-containing protein BDA1-like [Spinacia oleracea]|uniref:Ankyrin repeat-containing protein BDA1-like n=1 Tax=Spinacia oleracea TaxID=3562 RepID=A0A9R0JAB2_SPIOL|nr:ankyrin repeat-containing protein BDA1-like [Spinacia oleracea]
MEMEKRLYEAALEGSVSNLKALIQEDPLILDRISPTFFQDTPLHVATLRGHFEFARAVLGRNPRLATEADSLGHLPLHVASTKGHLEIVQELTRVIPSSCLARSKDGKLPLHLAIMKGVRVEVVSVLAQACLESTRSRLDRGDTALHLCVKYENLDAFQVILEELMKGEIIDGNNLLNAKNDDGNTVLHLAALQKHFEMMKHLLATPGIEPNAMNNNGLTSLDLVENSPRDLRGLELLNFLLRSNAMQRSTNLHSSLTPIETQPLTSHSGPFRPKKSWKIFFTFNGNNQLEDMKGEIIIIAAIIAATNALPMIYMRVNGPDLTEQYSTNSASFVPAVTIMSLLIAGFPLSNKLCAWVVIQSLYTSMGFLGLDYLGAIVSNEGRYSSVNFVFVFVSIWFGLLMLVSALNIIRLVVWIVTSIKMCMKRRRLRGRRDNGLTNP